MRIHVLQHVSFEPPGLVAEWASLHDHPLSYTFLFEENRRWPAPGEFDFLVLLGGPMSIDDTDQYGWLETEKIFIRQAIDAGKTILGICLGCQLLAEAFGAEVYPNTEKEIGFFPVTKTTAGKNDELLSHIPDPWNVFHWHGDTFDLPDGATQLLSSPVCAGQAFRKGKCIGIQFHPELNTSLLLSMIANEGHELVKAAYVQSSAEILKNDISAKNKDFLFALLTKMLE